MFENYEKKRIHTGRAKNDFYIMRISKVKFYKKVVAYPTVFSKQRKFSFVLAIFLRSGPKMLVNFLLKKIDILNDESYNSNDINTNVWKECNLA